MRFRAYQYLSIYSSEDRTSNITAAGRCNALGVNMARIEYVGGWAPRSAALIQHYIDPTVIADAAAAVFFGHLLPALPNPAAADGPAAPRGEPPGAAGGV